MNDDKSLGEILKEEREKKGLSIKDINRITKISTTILKALEDENYNELPSYVYTIGLLRKYAEILDLEFERLKDTFDTEYKKANYPENKARQELNSSFREIEEEKSKTNKFSLTIIILICIFVIIGISIYLLNSNIIKNKDISIKEDDKKAVEKKENNSQRVVADIINKKDEIPDKGEIKEKDSLDNVSNISPIEIARELKERNNSNEIDNLNIVTLEFTDDCWIHVDIDGKKELDFIAKKGISKDIKFKKYFEIDIGNASAVKIKYNDQTITGLGGWRQPIKDLLFKLDNSGNLVFTKK
ncbi:MAG: DUF4115 domain-containing protein [Deferribacterota bacterium]|nr:DUF4115 domain-containing protein [Deferribacterota bacterium]